MNKYEAMLIFPDSFKDDMLDGALGRAKGEIERCGGKVQSTTRLGRRQFARNLDKQQAGQYFVVNFEMEGGGITSLMARFKLDEEIFRVQIVRAVPQQEVKAETPAA